MTAVTLVPLDAVRPSTYNPRITDPARLELVKLSLRKLGFVLPIYADQQGEILSGHQRHLAASELGWEQVPVVFTQPLDLPARRNLNVVFNRATNDLQRGDTSETLNEVLDGPALHALGETLPDKQGDDRFPCLRLEQRQVAEFVAANAGRWNDYARNLANTLDKRNRIRMPVVARRDGTVVNGIGRIQFLSEEGEDWVEVVFLPDGEAAFAEAMLNRLSMDFNIHERYADILRHNSFRRARGTRLGKWLGMGMTLPLGLDQPNRFDIHNEANFELYRRVYGERILDFGAGRLEDVTLLKTKGIDTDAFEPFVLTPGSDTINPDLARELTLRFLDAVAAGKQWTSIFLQAVLNSVPFEADRQHVIRLLAALAGPFTTVYATTSSRTKSNYRAALGQNYLHENQNRSIAFKLEYESGIVLGEYASRPKVQKFFHLTEFVNLFRREFRIVLKQKRQGGFIWCAVQQPRAVDRTALAAAIAFEFDLPYPDGSRMGLVPQALDAFSQRLGVTLELPESIGLTGTSSSDDGGQAVTRES